MTIVKRIINRIKNKTIIDAVKNQSGKYKRKKWEKIVASGADFYSFNHKNLFQINLPIDSELSQYIFQKIFEKEEIKFTEKFLKEGDYFIDIGTNIGFFSLLASSKVGGSGKVISFEPTLNTYNRFLDNIELNKFKNITPIRKAISDKSGELEIHTSSEGFDAWNSFTKPTVGSKYNKETVETITLDSFFDSIENIDRIKLIKIDVEGWEKFVLLGGVKYLKKENAATILIEFEEAHTKNAGYNCSELYEILIQYGYKIYKLKNGKLIHQPKSNNFISCNLIAKKK